MFLPSRVKEPIKYLVFSLLAPVGHWFSLAGVPILTYHSLDESRSPISMTPSAFRQQMQYLKAWGFRAIALSDFVERLKKGRPFPEKGFVLTFDDGFKNVYQVAFPVLQELGFTATIFLVTDHIGRSSSWGVGKRVRRTGVSRLPLLDWNEVTEMYRYGFAFESHGSRHLHLTHCEPARIRNDVERSKQIIEDKLGSLCQIFCYPYGEWNETVRQIIQEIGFEGAVTTNFGRNGYNADPYTLRRIGSAHFTNLPVFKACIYGTYGWHLHQKRAWCPQGSCACGSPLER